MTAPLSKERREFCEETIRVLGAGSIIGQLCHELLEAEKFWREQCENASGYITRVLQASHPEIELLPNLLGQCTQMDNVLAGALANNKKVVCSYCGKTREYASREEMLSDLTNHLESGECPKHPMLQAAEWCEKKDAEIAFYKNALKKCDPMTPSDASLIHHCCIFCGFSGDVMRNVAHKPDCAWLLAQEDGK